MEPISPTAPPLPGGQILQQFWADLVFLHWRVDAADVRPLLPEGIEPDIFDGSSWVGLIPFRMLDSAFFGGPAIPYFGSFIEINVRLYGVDRNGKRGVVFASLEASRLAAVLAAQVAFRLPYYWASSRLDRVDDIFHYSSRRFARGAPSTDVMVRASNRRVEDDPLAEFLTARWRLFVAKGTRVFAQDNHHLPWPLFEAELLGLDDGLFDAAGLPGITSRAPDSVMYSPGVLTTFSGAHEV